MYLQVRGNELRDVAGVDDENGPKRTRNASVWALGKFLFVFFVFFTTYIVSTGYIYEPHDVDGDDDRNGPKRMRLASVWAISFIFLFLFTKTINYYIQVMVYEIRKRV